MTAGLLFFVTVLACSEAPAPQSSPVPNAEAEPHGEPAKISMGATPLKPVSISTLSTLIPGFAALEVASQQEASRALNLTPGPCEVCEDRTIAHCLSGVAPCAILTKLSRRAVRLAKDGKAADMIKVAINYPDFWYPRMGEGTPVSIHLYRDLEGSFAEQTEEIRAELVQLFGEQVVLTLHDDPEEDTTEIGVRTRPTWFINGHRFRGVQSVNALGRFIAYELSDQ